MNKQTAYGLTIETREDQTAMTHDFDGRDMLNRRTDQLHALLVSISGAGGESFHNMADALKDDLIWLAVDLSAEVRLLARTTTSAQEKTDNITPLTIKAAYNRNETAVVIDNQRHSPQAR
jgi:hypothetical protein